MSYIPDLAAVSYSHLEGSIRAVGWLESSHDFTRGLVAPEFSRRLMALVKRPISRLFGLGMHWCSLCFCRRHHFEQIERRECPFDH
jgi:hypothetical protein